jgi:hypothetical protein
VMVRNESLDPPHITIGHRISYLISSFTTSSVHIYVYIWVSQAKDKPFCPTTP